MLEAADSDLSQAMLVLLGHGSTQNDEPCAVIYQHAATLRRRGVFAEVREAFWKQSPQLKRVLAEAGPREVFIVPVFISEGYFSDEVIPRELGFGPKTTGNTRQLRRGDRILAYCEPVGTHDSMTCLLLARAEEIVKRFPCPCGPQPADTTLFIAGHGTERSGTSRQVIERQAELIQSLGQYAAVHAVFMEERPRIGDCYALAATRNLVVVPFFISDGPHVREDLPVLLGEPETVVRERLAAGEPTWRNPTQKHGKLVWYTPAVGTEPHLAEIILERVRAAAANGDRSRR